MITLNKSDKCLLQTLARLKFATRAHLAFWCDVHVSTILRRLRVLQKAGMIVANENREPMIWSIKNLAAKLMLISPPSGGRRASWSAMSHACHANEVEIMLNTAKDSKGFCFINKIKLLERGLHPGFGEHGGRDDANKDYLILVDDYMMKPERIGHTWTRIHHPPRKFFDGNRQLSWSKIVNHFIVATTDEFRAEQHAAWIERHEIPARVITIKPLWR